MPFVNSLVVLDIEGDRLFAKYYDGRTKAEQVVNESALFKKTKSVSAKSEGICPLGQEHSYTHDLTIAFANSAEVILVDQEIVVFKSGIECKFFVSGPGLEVRLFFHTPARLCKRLYRVGPS